MPLITVAYSSSRTAPSLRADIAAAVTEFTAKILHKDPKVTAIIVKSVDAADWFAGGKSLATALGGGLFDSSIASARPRSYSGNIRCLIGLERVDLLLELFDLSLLLLHQLIGRLVLIAAASGADDCESSNCHRE